MIAATAFVAVACAPTTPPATTTSTSEAPTSSTASTTLPPGCDDYTPGGVTLSDASASANDTITVSGTGYEGTTINLIMRKADNTEVDPGVSVVVPGGGNWSTGLTIPNTVDPGTWYVVATADGCTAEATAEITIV